MTTLEVGFFIIVGLLSLLGVVAWVILTKGINNEREKRQLRFRQELKKFLKGEDK